MGAFNMLLLNNYLCCPACKTIQNWTIQFKYGLCRQLEYRLFDAVEWAGYMDTGDAAAKIVLVEGIAENDCSSCGQEVYARIFVDDNKIVAASLVVKPICFTAGDDGDYIIINK
ncbi:hypothetical protein HF324_31900 [Chitinophaga oryzae]|uniref:Uncharacterized protein n=1 Tax=Chitinophaga oryzae TaxID=2725414 RepID=A0AAE7DAQ7_9BACT|nr:hypothetical protein [Chitinophaga oryzae]QJB35658.1 hypothetical protein HF329_31905 [Chitinophaga oryzae]QJB42196.1 hypothetical protein HF324_31900 [Chitinophaga oryzae]